MQSCLKRNLRKPDEADKSAFDELITLAGANDASAFFIKNSNSTLERACIR